MLGGRVNKNIDQLISMEIANRFAIEIGIFASGEAKFEVFEGFGVYYDCPLYYCIFDNYYYIVILGYRYIVI